MTAPGPDPVGLDRAGAGATDAGSRRAGQSAADRTAADRAGVAAAAEAEPATAPAGETVHGGCVAMQGRGALILGPPGSGKSALALALIALGAELVADDRTELRAAAGRLIAAAPAPLRGLIEARGVGVLRMDHRPQAEIVLTVELAGARPERLPPRATRTCLGVETPLIRLADGAAAPVVAALLSGATIRDPEAPVGAPA